MKISSGALICLAVTGVFLYLVSPVLTPFVVGAFFAWLLNPLVRHLVKWHLPRWLAVALVFLLLVTSLAIILVLAIPVISAEIVRLVHLLPELARFIQQQVPVDLSNSIPTDLGSLKGTLLAESGLKAGGLMGVAVKTAFRSGATLAEWIGRLILVPVVTLYLLYDWDKLLASIRRLLPTRVAPTVLELARRCDAVLAAFFRGQLLVMLTLGVVYSIGLTLMGLQLGVLIGITIGLLAIIPYVGVITGAFFACIAAWMQFGAWHALLPVLGFFAVMQSIDGMFITPNLVGHRIGLHPVIVIFAVLAGGAMAGFTGVLLALPVAAMMRVLFEYFASRRVGSE